MQNKRRSLRLTIFDYTQNGFYFVTVCVKHKHPMFGEIINGAMILNDYGRIVEHVWNGLSCHYSNCRLDEYVIMPDHFHGIVEIVGAGLKPARIHGVSEIIRAFKTFSSRKINEMVGVKTYQW